MDIEEAIAWYRQRGLGLGRALYADIRQQLRRITAFPYSYPQIAGEFRQSDLHRFPYSIVYVVTASNIEVAALFPDGCDPARLRQRIDTSS
jgi:plasmid stabilization system protein ParE